ncbi:uncharacterized protein isoform X2 [Choristoneura fumiferana]|uniref:uncharacterized protein isoform X2 n=1 Tax=Choristoneura fumiferana TaxID=7141 RepID=UPI003D15CC7E
MCQTIEAVQQQHEDNSKLQNTSKLQESSSIQKPSNLEDRPDLQDTSDPVSSELQEELCPPDCPCRRTPETVKSSIRLQIFFNVLGIFFALFAIYLMVTTNSNLYLIFWICFSVLRRMMGKTRTMKMKKD